MSEREVRETDVECSAAFTTTQISTCNLGEPKENAWSYRFELTIGFYRVSVVPGHAPKVFVPYQNVLGTPASSTAAATATAAAPPPLAPPKARHVFVSAAVTELHDGYVELDRDLLEHERDLEGDEEEVDRLTAELEHSQLEADGTRAKKEAARRLKWDYLIYVRRKSASESEEGTERKRADRPTDAGSRLHLASTTRLGGSDEERRRLVPRGEWAFANLVPRRKRTTADDELDRPNKPRSTRPARS